MKEIRDLKVTQIRIFPVDEIALKSFLRDSALKRIKDTYKLKQSPPVFFDAISPEFKNIILDNGEYKFKDRIYLIDQLKIEERRILIRMSAHSEIVDNFFKNLSNLLIELDLREKKPEFKPIVKAEETSCVVKLDFCIKDIFKQTPLNDFDDYIAKTTQAKYYEVEVIPTTLKFKLSYLKLPDSFKRQKVTFNDKDFIIEIRDRTSYNEQIYFTFSPIDSETHFQLLEELEKRIIKN